ncbi:AraC family transcriptional regulator [Stappia indica]|uniref:AraC family transcriptional regulator n=1 Tax=Stappia indica TaxID=538381 RepID=UPI001CD60CAB|nr:AraC family transcriptional regulator [Stappia indica]MCA1297399.1 AraC family transcriptional regulator [Stappia indica]
MSDQDETPVPMSRYFLFETSDLDEARERVGKVFCRHRLDYAGRGRGLAIRQHLAPLGRLALSHITYGEEVEIDAGEPENWFMVHSVDRGGCEMKVGDRFVSASPAMSVISSATLPLHMTWTENCDHLVLKVDRSALERHLASLLNDAVIRPIEFYPELPTGSCENQGYRRALNFVIEEIDQDDTFFRTQVGIRHLEQTLMTMLLTTFRNNYSEALAAPVSPSAPRHVVRAEDFMIANADRAISVEDIAAAAGVGVRTLFDGFRRFRATTPMARLRALRLEGVRKDLLAADASGSVTDIALKWGFTNVGRFADTYRRRYGELPSYTLKRRR